jgi:hypothetical protein
MPYEMKEGDFALFENDKKTNDKQPDYKGKIMVGGVVKEIAAWIKQSQNGADFLAGRVSEYRQPPPKPLPWVVGKRSVRNWLRKNEPLAPESQQAPAQGAPLGAGEPLPPPAPAGTDDVPF